jgi:hypothetical protein
VGQAPWRPGRAAQAAEAAVTAEAVPEEVSAEAARVEESGEAAIAGTR